MDLDDSVSPVEVAVVGLSDRDAILGWLDGALRQLLGPGLGRVEFVAGRIDAVYGVTAVDGQRLLVKVHRPPVDLAGRALVVEAQQKMAEAGFPCATPLAGPVEVDGRIVSVETLLTEGGRGDAHDAAVRASVAAGLAEHIRILSALPGFARRVERDGRPVAWCYYAGGAWSITHDPIFDFSATPPAYAWLQEFAQRSAHRIVELRTPAAVVAAHADWYAGNLRFDGTRLAAAFDWDLMSDTEPIVAGITAGMFSAGTALTATPPTPEEASAFMADYESAAGVRFTGPERRLATAAACWSVAYTARCDVSQLERAAPQAGSALKILASRAGDYEALDW